jgi:hypothetical protein
VNGSNIELTNTMVWLQLLDKNVEQATQHLKSLAQLIPHSIWDSTGKYMSPEATNQLNNWQDKPELILGWRQFINWCWEVIKHWWNELWN